MINIIEKGYTGKRKWIYKEKCEKCECVFEFDSAEIKTKTFLKVFKDRFVECPCCGKKIYVDEYTNYRTVRVDEKGEVNE